MTHPFIRPPAVRAFDDLFANAAAAVLALATLEEIQRHNNGKSDEDPPRADERSAPGIGAPKHVCLSTAAVECKPSKTPRTGYEAVFKLLQPALLPRIQRPQKYHK